MKTDVKCFSTWSDGKSFLIHSATLDYVFTSSDLTFDGATSSQTESIPLLEDIIVEGSETVIVTLLSADPAVILNLSTASVTIEDNDSKCLVVSYSYLLKG